MKKDAIERVTLERLMRLSAELEFQLDKNPKTQPMMAVLAMAREQAAIATKGLVYEDPNNAEKIRELQHEVRRYDDLVAWTHQILVEGKEADRRLAEMDRLEFNELVGDPEVQQEREALRGDRTQED